MIVKSRINKIRFNWRLGLVVFFSSVFFTACSDTGGKKTVISDSLRKQAIDQLRLNLRTQPKLVKVHAAEFLVWLGLDEQDEVYKTFLEEEKKFSTEPLYRIPVWRVLAQTEKEQQKKKKWIGKIMDAWLDSTASDRAAAAESLSKIDVSLLEYYPGLTGEILQGNKSPLSVYTFWSASTRLAGADSIRTNRKAFMSLVENDTSDHIKGIAAYSLRHLGGITGDEWHRLAGIALHKTLKPEFKVYLASAAFVLSPEDSLYSPLYLQIRNTLLENKDSKSKDDRMEMAAALADKGVPEDIPVLVSLLNDENPVIGAGEKDRSVIVNSPANAEVHSFAAYAILEIDRRYAPAGE